MMTGMLLLAAALAAAPQTPTAAPQTPATAPAAAAQAAAPAQAPAAGAQTASIRGTYDIVKGYLLKAADQVPEEHYAFKPTADVRSLGALFGHIADANFGICGTASGDKPAMTGIEKSKTSKAELKEALAASFAFCDKAFASMTDARAAETVKFFLPGAHTRLGILAFNSAHDFEHYGNVVTYMRLKGLVPPSSAGQ
jgi:uncharacterized damage-inducible protein DinB